MRVFAVCTGLATPAAEETAPRQVNIPLLGIIYINLGQALNSLQSRMLGLDERVFKGKRYERGHMVASWKR